MQVRLLSIVLALLGLILRANAAPPNILLIVADDMG